MARERADSFLSRFLFRGSKEHGNEPAAAGAEAASESPSETVTEEELIWASNGERSVQDLVERVLNGKSALVITGFQDFLSAMSIILRARPRALSEEN